jgi:endoglucanase
VRFEILNEPVAPENRQLNPFMHRMLAAIRESNPTRIVYVTSNRWSGFGTLPDVELPDDKFIALTLHNYEPFVFTHQKAPWAGFTATMPAVMFPGPVPDLTGQAPDFVLKRYPAGTELTVAEMEAAFEKVAAWVQAHAPGIEVYVGEFGVYHVADPASTRHWVSAMVHACERRGWGWAVWDYKGGFAVRDATGQGTPVLDGLFAK